MNSEDKRESLKFIIDGLIDLYEREDVVYRFVEESIHSSKYTHGGVKDYGDTVFENIVIVYDR